MNIILSVLYYGNYSSIWLGWIKGGIRLMDKKNVTERVYHYKLYLICNFQYLKKM